MWIGGNAQFWHPELLLSSGVFPLAEDNPNAALSSCQEPTPYETAANPRVFQILAQSQSVDYFPAEIALSLLALLQGTKGKRLSPIRLP